MMKKKIRQPQLNNYYGKDAKVGADNFITLNSTTLYKCPICPVVCRNLRSHFASLVWKPKGTNRQLNMEPNAVRHREYYYSHHIPATPRKKKIIKWIRFDSNSFH